MRFQKRDGVILESIRTYDGLLARRHLKEMFWPHATLRAAQKRLAKLVNNGYLSRPTSRQRGTQPIPEPIFWLDWKGILWIATQEGVKVNPPANQGENQLRRLANDLRKQGVRWLREPRWLQLAHDLAVVDFRLAVVKSVTMLPSQSLEDWRHESEFRSDGDIVKHQVRDRDGTVRTRKKRVYPDSYFVIVDRRRLTQGLLGRARFLLELDNSTHPNERFGREKIAPGLAYIRSPEYKARFGDNSGRWLVVTTGRIRMRNLMSQTHKVARTGARSFFFTTFDKLYTDNVLTGPIWMQVGGEEPRALLST